MSAAGTPWLFTSDDPEAALAGFGWSANVVQPGEAGADFGRLPQPVTRCTTGVPRSFLVTATRQGLADSCCNAGRWGATRDSVAVQPRACLRSRT